MSKLVWVRVFIWLGCMTGFLYQTSSMLSLYFEYPFSVTLVEEVRRNLLFPAATICIHRWIDISKLCPMFVNICGDKSQIVQQFDNQWTFLSRDVLSRAPVAHHPDDLFQCQMRSSVSECLTFPCSRNIRMTYYRYPNQMCYTIDSYQGTNSTHPLHRCPSPWNYELILRAQWNSSATVSLHEPEALPLVIHSPYTCPPDKLSSVMVQPGMTYTVAVSQEKAKRLPAPYKSRCSDYKSPGIQDKYFGYLTQDSCIQDCEMKLEMKLCQCVRTVHEFAATFGGQICDLIRDDICARKVRNSKPYLDCSTKCRVACEEIRYDLKLSSLAVDKSTYGTGKDKFSFIIKFSSDTQKVSEYQPNLPVIEAFGFFGGYIGIWLGLSLLSVLLNLEAKLMKAISRKTEKSKSTQMVMVVRQKPRF